MQSNVSHEFENKEGLLLPEEYNLIGVCRIVGKPHTLKYKASSHSKRNAKVFEFKSIQ